MRIGRSGREVSRICLGMMSYGSGGRHPWILGAQEVVIATKVYGRMSEGPNRSGLSRKHVFDECFASLRRLRTDYVDLYQVHRFDPHTPVEETLEALHDPVKAGHVRYLGASSMAAWQFMKMLGLSERHGWARFASVQDHYNLLEREGEREIMALCRGERLRSRPAPHPDRCRA